jgi:hypothetical protein
MSDLIEVGSARQTLRAMLSDLGHPMIVIRVGYPQPGAAAPGATPRRPAETVMERREGSP